MRLILDTHILLWTLAASAALSPRARDLLLDPQNIKYVSAASLWEIAIKHRLRREGPNAMPFGAAKAHELADIAGLKLLPIGALHAAAVEQLPLGRHADPFDRMLIAQARAENMLLMTHDRALAAYGASVLLV